MPLIPPRQYKERRQKTMKIGLPKFLKTKKQEREDMKKKAVVQNYSSVNIAERAESLVDVSELFAHKEALRNVQASITDRTKKITELEERILLSAKVSQRVVVGPYTIVELSVPTRRGIFAGQGISRKSEYDENIPDRGYSIALGRARKSLLNKLNKTNPRQKDVFVG